MSPSTSRKISTAEAQEALKIHSEAERRRRERINAHLATLRRMIPDARQVCTSCRALDSFVPSVTADEHAIFFKKNAQLKSNFSSSFYLISTAPQMINSKM
jgi:hypothetical protein